MRRASTFAGDEVSATAYHDYTGVDISTVAIDKAKRRTDENDRPDKSRLFRSEISSYVPAQQFDVILFRDSIYYTAPPGIRPMLERYSKYLKRSGVFIVRIVGKDKHKSIVDDIARNFEIVEKYWPEQSTTGHCFSIEAFDKSLSMKSFDKPDQTSRPGPTASSGNRRHWLCTTPRQATIHPLL